MTKDERDALRAAHKRAMDWRDDLPDSIGLPCQGGCPGFYPCPVITLLDAYEADLAEKDAEIAALKERFGNSNGAKVSSPNQVPALELCQECGCPVAHGRVPRMGWSWTSHSCEHQHPDHAPQTAIRLVATLTADLAQARAEVERLKNPDGSDGNWGRVS